MDEVSRFAIGIDVGTENVRAVVGTVGKDGKINVVGYNESKNSGMRKGVVANLAGPAESIDRMLGEVERMSGVEVNSATISINGVQILTTKIDGMIAVGMADHEITYEDIERVRDVAIAGRIPANRDILDIIPLGYAIDGQGGMKDPVGMIGSRLEMSASVVSVLSPNHENLRRSVESAKVIPERVVPSVMAAAKAVLNERQVENGVAIVDIGATTTGIAVYEEGDVQYVGVVPVGSLNITNDLAIVLEINTDIAEEIKRRYVSASFQDKKDISVKIGREEWKFEREKIDEVVQARLQEIFEKVRKELKKSGFDHRLPEGIVLTGGGARLKNIDIFAKEVLEAAVMVGEPNKIAGVADAIWRPEYATAIGLMLYSAESNSKVIDKMRKKEKGCRKVCKDESFIKKILKKF